MTTEHDQSSGYSGNGSGNGNGHGSHREHDRPARQPFASVVIVSYNTAEHIEGCLRSLLNLDYPRCEIIVVDNGSSDGSVEHIRANFPDVEVVPLGENKGFAGGASVGLFMARGDILATVNPDARLDPQWMNAVAATLESLPDVAIVGSKILYPDRCTIQHAGGVVHYPLATTDHIGRGETDRGQFDQSRFVSFVTGAAMAMRRDVGRSLNFFDESLYPMYFEDVDLCWRAKRQGFRTMYQPRAIAYHEESVTMDRRGALYYTYYHANRLRFVVKHYTPEQVIFDFLPAEADRVTGDMPAEDRRASLALLDNRMVGEGAGVVNTGATGRTGSATVGTGTHSVKVNGSGRHFDKQESRPVPDETIQGRMDALQAHIGEIMGGWHIYDLGAGRSPAKPPKTVAGRLRNFVSRLYTWPYVQKQIEYNASTARALREVSWQMADLQSRVALLSLLSAGLVSKNNQAVQELSMEVDAMHSEEKQEA